MADRLQGMARKRLQLTMVPRTVRTVLLAFAVLVVAPAAAGTDQQPSTAPILRVETGMHTTLIRRLSVDKVHNRLISAGDDKTVRVWQLPEARLVSTLRVPIGEGHEGRIYALAVAPDGKTIAVAGWTGWQWDGVASLYFFDAETGELRRRYSGFADVISNLVWMPDGKHLMVGLMGRAGVHLLRLKDLQLVASDTAYNDKVQEIDVRRDGISAAISLDGMVRLYDAQLKLLGRAPIAGGKLPTTVRIAPDGSKLAIGFADTAEITVLDTNTLKRLHTITTSKNAQQDNFYSVAWSSDGRYIYAGGEYKGSGKTPLYRWDNGGRGKEERIPLVNNRITEIMQMANNNIAFATEDPSIGMMDGEAQLVAYRGPDIVDFSRVGEQFKLSADGLTVSYPPHADGKTIHTFSSLQAGDQNITATAVEPMHSAVTGAPGWEILHAEGSFEPKINGKSPRLDDYETARSYALAPDGNAVLLGTEWAIRLLDRNARELWSVALPAVAWAVNISRNGEMAVAALSDGTIRWYRMENGNEVMAYYPHLNGTEWIAWVPQGYYISSIHGDNYIGWHVNRGKEMTPDFYHAVQFDRILYRPDVFKQAVTPVAARGATTSDTGIGKMPEFNISRLAEIAPPRLRLNAGEMKLRDDHVTLGLRLSGEKNSLAMKDLTVFVNDIPITTTSERALVGRDREQFSREIEVALLARENTIRIEAFNGISMGVAETFFAVDGGQQIKPVIGELYLLAIGVNAFPKLPDDVTLAYAANDANEMTQALVKKGKGVFQQVHTLLINDNTELKPNRETVKDALNFIQQAKPNDAVVVFLASHGISDEAGNYYFVPRDAEEEDIERVLDGGKVKSLLPWTEFFDALRLTAGKRLLIVDTCQARNIEGRFEAHSLMKRSASSLFSLMLASKGDEESQEHPAARHGLFTHAVLSAMNNKSDSDNNGQLSLRELYLGMVPILEKNRDKRVGPQTPQMVAPDNLQNFMLVNVGD